jgi:hypothetical protein
MSADGAHRSSSYWYSSGSSSLEQQCESMGELDGVISFS